MIDVLNWSVAHPFAAVLWGVWISTTLLLALDVIRFHRPRP